jgi:hypothetical protein
VASVIRVADGGYLGKWALFFLRTRTNLRSDMFGLGPMELLVFLVVGLLYLGVPIAIIVLLVALLRKLRSDDTLTSNSQLRDENQRLRDELAVARNGPPSAEG